MYRNLEPWTMVRTNQDNTSGYHEIIKDYSKLLILYSYSRSKCTLLQNSSNLIFDLIPNTGKPFTYPQTNISSED